MIRCLLLVCLMGIPAICLAERPVEFLPTPDYEPDAKDPAWLKYAAQFHGHLGPWAAAGLRAGMTARSAAGAKGYFDVQVTVEGPFTKPPRSCFLDGLQVSTGATLGKRNLKWIKADEIVVRMQNTKTCKQVEVRPTPELMSLLASFKPKPKTPQSQHDHEADHDHAHDHQHLLEDIARRIAKLPEKRILRVQMTAK
jgi:formylmethanofuran dehydrogenase subunit E